MTEVGEKYRNIEYDLGAHCAPFGRATNALRRRFDRKSYKKENKKHNLNTHQEHTVTRMQIGKHKSKLEKLKADTS